MRDQAERLHRHRVESNAFYQAAAAHPEADPQTYQYPPVWPENPYHPPYQWSPYAQAAQQHLDASPGLGSRYHGESASISPHRPLTSSLINRSPGTATSHSHESEKSPRKSFRDRLQFFKTKENRSQPEISIPGNAHGFIVSPGLAGVPPKAKAILGTESAIPSHSANELARHGSNKIKQLFCKRDTSAEEQVPDKPKMKLQKSATTSGIDISPSKFSDHTVTSSQNRYDFHWQSPFKNGSGLARSQSLKYFDHSSPPTPPAKNTPPDHKASIVDSLAAPISDPFDSDPSDALDAYLDEDAGWFSVGTRVSPTQYGSYGFHSVPMLVNNPSLHSLRVDVDSPGFIDDSAFDRLRSSVDGRGLHGLGLATDNLTAANDIPDFNAEDWYTRGFAPNSTVASPMKVSRRRRPYKRHTLDVSDLPTLIEERAKEEEEAEVIATKQDTDGKIEHNHLAVGRVPKGETRVTTQAEFRHKSSLVDIVPESVERGAPALTSAAMTFSSPFIKTPSDTDSVGLDDQEQSHHLSYPERHPPEYLEFLPATTYVPPPEDAKKSSRRRTAKLLANASIPDLLPLSNVGKPVWKEGQPLTNTGLQESLEKARDEGQTAPFPAKAAESATSDDGKMEQIAAIVREIMRQTPPDTPIESILALLQNRSTELRLAQQDGPIYSVQGTSASAPYPTPDSLLMPHTSPNLVQTQDLSSAASNPNISLQAHLPVSGPPPAQLSASFSAPQLYSPIDQTSSPPAISPQSVFSKISQNLSKEYDSDMEDEKAKTKFLTPFQDSNLRIDPLFIIKHRLARGEHTPRSLHQASQRAVQGAIITEAVTAEREGRVMRVGSDYSFDGGARLVSLGQDLSSKELEMVEREMAMIEWEEKVFQFQRGLGKDGDKRDGLAGSTLIEDVADETLVEDANNITRAGAGYEIDAGGKAISESEDDTDEIGREKEDKTSIGNVYSPDYATQDQLGGEPHTIDKGYAAHNDHDAATNIQNQNRDRDSRDAMRGLEDANRRLQELYDGLARKVAEMQSSLRSRSPRTITDDEESQRVTSKD